MIGERLRHYHIEKRLADTEFGPQYLAHDERLDRDVTITVLKEGTLAGEEKRAQCVRRFNALSRIEHDHVGRVHALDSHDGQDFIVSEWVGRGTPAERLAAWKALTADEIVRIGIEAAEGLAVVHERGVAHGAIDDQSLVYGAEGHVKLMNFAPIASRWNSEDDRDQRKTVAGMHFAAPELHRGAEPTIQSDIFALGVVLYELAAGVKPFRAATADRLTEIICKQDVQPIRKHNDHISALLQDVILRCLEKEPHRRFALATDLVRALRETVHQPATKTGRWRVGTLFSLLIGGAIVAWAMYIWSITGFQVISNAPAPEAPAATRPAIDHAAEE